MDIGYAGVSTAKQDLTRQLAALVAAGIDPAHIHVDKKSGATTTRPGLRASGSTISQITAKTGPNARPCIGIYRPAPHQNRSP
ncbi:recombinase family protein [Arthrobacter sp. TB 26]|uniref:recombinase family protein n=1 Tax=Arthrobacter sp. TB 26 TaxID=494420 RepID=UPI0009FE540D|nr:recombinase family protein [Arthrobacter sp. TB 26]